MALLPKGGLNIGGHKIPWEAIAAIAGVAGVLLVLRSRQQGSNVASVGQAPAASTLDPSLAGFGASGFTPDYSTTLANIEQQLAGLNQASVTAPATTAPASGFMGLIRPAGQVPAYDSTNPGIPLWSALGTGRTLLEDIPFGSQLSILGEAQGSPNAVNGATTYYDVNYGGLTGWISSFDLAQITGSGTLPNLGIHPQARS